MQATSGYSKKGLVAFIALGHRDSQFSVPYVADAFFGDAFISEGFVAVAHVADHIGVDDVFGLLPFWDFDVEDAGVSEVGKGDGSVDLALVPDLDVEGGAGIAGGSVVGVVFAGVAAEDHALNVEAEETFGGGDDQPSDGQIFRQVEQGVKGGERRTFAND